MASAWSEEEALVCPVCLDTLKDPATLPCGHSYCLLCIQNHWDKEAGMGKYSCPQCRQVYKPRPSLAKSTVLVEVMEKLRTKSLRQTSSSPVYLEVLPDSGGPQPTGVYPQLPTVSPRPCPQHNRPLHLFCHDDRESLCEECCQHGHRGHRVLQHEEERRERQKELLKMQAEVQTRVDETEKTLSKLPNVARQHKALVQALQQERLDVFAQLVSCVNDAGAQADELLGAHESSLGSRVEGQIHRLEQEAVQLRWRSEELSSLSEMQDHICFLKNFFTMEPLGPSGTTEESLLSREEEIVAAVRLAMKELQESVQELCKAGLSKMAAIVNESPVVAGSNGARAASTTQNTVYETQGPPPLPPPRLQESESSLRRSPSLQPSCQASAPPPPAPLMTPVGIGNPEPKTREELLKFRFEPTMDANTAYRHLQLSAGGRKATMRAENVHLTDHPERFHFWRQVLCREPLAGSPYYWEVEWTGQKITIGVTYKEMERKGSDDKSRLGHNPLSWTLYWSGTGFSFWHDGKEKLLGSPKAKQLGVYLDQHAGVLAFYRIASNKADLIHQHQIQFTGPLYAGFRFSAVAGSSVTICQLD